MGATRTKHVVLFPFPAQGHHASFLAVAVLLARELPDAAVTLVSTPRNVAALRSSLSSSTSSSSPAVAPPQTTAANSIAFHALPFVPADHGLPAGCESTSSLPVPSFVTLFEAMESLEPAFDDYISRLRRGGGGEQAAADVCVVADVFVAWTERAARRHGCAHAVLVSCGAFGAAIFGALWDHMPALPFGADDGDSLRLPEYPDLAPIHRSQLSPVFLLPGGDLSRRWTAFYHRAMGHARRTDAVLANTVEEFERAGLAMMRRAAGKVPVWPIGPLVRGGGDDDETGVLRWLDARPASSVLYISFGSQNSIRADQMTELAAALEATGRPFVWAMRPPVGLDVAVAGAGDEWWLPEGFEGRARGEGRGVVVRGWAPQVRVLAHSATGAFLSHCGWNSVLESLTRGVPILAWPLAAEQFYNARVLAEEWGVCVEVARGNLPPESSAAAAVDRSRVAEAVEAVMGDTAAAKAMRRRAREVQEVLAGAWRQDGGGGSSVAALHEFLRAMNLR